MLHIKRAAGVEIDDRFKCPTLNSVVPASIRDWFRMDIAADTDRLRQEISGTNSTKLVTACAENVS